MREKIQGVKQNIEIRSGGLRRFFDHLPFSGDNRGIHEQKSGDWPQRVLLTMEPLIAEFEIYLFRENKAKDTSQKYLKDIRQFCKAKAILSLDGFTSEGIKDWMLALRQRNLTTGTIANHLWALKCFHKFIKREKKIPLFEWDIEIPRVPAPEVVEYLEEDELKQLFLNLDENNVRDLRLRAFIEVRHC